MTNARNRRRRYAVGRHAIAECMRSGQKMRYRDLVEDGQIPGLLVAPDWYEPRHPQELPVDTSDSITLWRPFPEISVNEGEFDVLSRWQTFIVEDCPPTPDLLVFSQSTTLSGDASEGDLVFGLEDAVTYEAELCLYVELDGGGWFISIVPVASPNCPAFRVGSVLPFEGVASAGNEVWIGVAGNMIPLLDGSWATS